MAGGIGFVLASLATAALLLQGGAGVATSPRRPSVSLSIEPAAFASPRSPVVLPGYLLPADNYEEPNHVGR